MARPGKPNGHASGETIVLSWGEPEELFKVYWFVVHYKPKGFRWHPIDEEFKNCTAQVRGLAPDTEYVFKVRMIDNNENESPWSEQSDIIKTERTAGQTAAHGYEGEQPMETSHDFVDSNNDAEDIGKPYDTKSKSRLLSNDKQCKPGKPCCVRTETTANSVVLYWDKTDKCAGYKINYERYKQDLTWTSQGIDLSTEPSARITGLIGNTDYVFRIRMIDERGDECGSWSQVSDVIRTAMSPACAFLELTQTISGEGTSREIKKMNFTEDLSARNEKLMIRKLTVGPDDKIFAPCKTILMMGETGSGKSLLIDRLINYVLCVDWNDPFRFQVIDLEENEKRRQNETTKSQTQWITIYSISFLENGKLDYRLNIIDTPGFGDTEGGRRDEKIKTQVETLFSLEYKHRLNSLDAICFVTKSSNQRLNDGQKRVCKSVLDIFAKNVAENFVVMITWADENPGKTLKVVEEAGIPFVASYEFNNYTLTSSSDIAQDFWTKAEQSCSSFFKHLRGRKPIGTIATQEIILERRSAEDDCRQLHRLVLQAVQERNSHEERKRLLESMERDLQNQTNNFEEIKHICRDHQEEKEKTEAEISNLDKTMIEAKEMSKKKTMVAESRKIPSKDEEKCHNCPECKATCHKGIGVFGRFSVWIREKLSGSCSHCKHGLKDHTIEEMEFITVYVEKEETVAEMVRHYEQLERDKKEHTHRLKSHINRLTAHFSMKEQTQTRVEETSTKTNELSRAITACKAKISEIDEKIKLCFENLEVKLNIIKIGQLNSQSDLTPQAFVESQLTEEEKHVFRSEMTLSYLTKVNKDNA